MEVNMKENGKMINKMERGKNFGQMVLSTKGHTLKGPKMDLDNLNGLMEIFMRGTLLIIIFVEKENIYLKIIECMKECGRIIKWRDLGDLNGQMVNFLKENIQMIKKMDLEYLVGQMEEFIKECGKMGNNRENWFKSSFCSTSTRFSTV